MSEAAMRGRRFGWRRGLRAAGAVLRSRHTYIAGGILAASVVLAQVGPAAWVGMTRFLGRPYCLSYSDVYMYPGGAFQRRGEDWIEVPTYRNVDVSYFDEIERTTDYIYIVNAPSRSNTKVSAITIRLPVCGGTAQVTVPSADDWIDTHTVWR
ncbi:hypothetical protein [Methylobacterium isbiliense]|jgi:hypothetical protein|nr:hypothetical protein [Methylobacterium isbiliense]MDN3621628.1 hypothetical protein [Methylobacterium isbiliense]